MGLIRTILLTGANGFLGSHILKHIINLGNKPVLYLRSTSDLWRIGNLASKCDIYISDESQNSLETLFSRYSIDTIIHTATEYGRDNVMTSILNTNVIFPTALIEVGIRYNLKYFLNTDSFFAKPIYNQSYLSNYTFSKRIFEEVLKGFSDRLKIINFRIEHVFGEMDSDQKFVSFVFRKLLNNAPELLLTDGKQKRDFVYVDDVASAYMHVLNNVDNLQKSYQEFEIGTGHSVSVRSFVEKIASITNAQTELRFGALPTKEGDIANSYANINPLKELGWKSSYTLDQAIKNIIINEEERFRT